MANVMLLVNAHIENMRKHANPNEYVPLANTASEAALLFTFIGFERLRLAKSAGLIEPKFETSISIATKFYSLTDTSKLTDADIDEFIEGYVRSMRTALSHYRNKSIKSTGRKPMKFNMLYNGWRRHSNNSVIMIELGYRHDTLSNQVMRAFEGIDLEVVRT